MKYLKVMPQKDYKIKSGNENFVHVRFTRVMKGKGKRTYDTHMVQLFTVKEYEQLLKNVERLGLAGTTQQDEMECIYDPRNKKPKKMEVPAEEPKTEAQEPTDEEKEAEEIKQRLTEKGIKFHPKTGIVKLREIEAKSNTE